MATTKNRKRINVKQKPKTKVPLKEIPENTSSNVKENITNNQQEEDSFLLHVSKKWDFVNYLGLSFKYPVLERLSVNNTEPDNNNEQDVLDNNLDSEGDDPKLIREEYIKCNHCDNIFDSRKSFSLHFRKEHAELVEYNCKICSKKFANRHSLQEHQIKHKGKKPYSCSKCNRRFDTLEKLTGHARRHAGKLPYQCKVCKCGFQLLAEYKKHMPVHDMKPEDRRAYKIYSCSDCDKKFRKPCDLERHRRVHTGERPYICAVCGNKFQQAHNMTKHMIIHTQVKPFQCAICSKQFGRSDVLTRHMLTHEIHKPFSCAVCKKTFARALQLTQHEVKHHGSSGEER